MACARMARRAIGTGTEAERQELSGQKHMNPSRFLVREFLTAAGLMENQAIRAPIQRLVRIEFANYVNPAP